ncbi:complement C1r subcomponent-like [Trichoplusia ni]|uniref:Complement C1r subcomponent-like n=1 Tax=Trichoplusia ni TaxID=7111 RepID=A0A7E5WK66_TRINI|nr:complement C1r subcomponent-like [Trichoplusia ni]
MSCGIDKSRVKHVYEGVARIETYPWLGILYYPYSHKKRFTTAVVLVTKQVALATASEIDKLPKYDFRSKAKVVLGYNCSAPGIGIRDYSYHPDFAKDTFSTLAMIQLETDHIHGIELRPICRPPSHFTDQQFFAMVLSDNCLNSQVRIYKMKYVSPSACKSYYRRTGLDIDSIWPSHTACARSARGGRCVWRSGAILVVKVGMRWRLLGFGVYGPGCQAPARFLDYGMYHTWVRRSIEKIGTPTVTTLASNHVILRRSKNHFSFFI